MSAVLERRSRNNRKPRIVPHHSSEPALNPYSEALNFHTSLYRFSEQDEPSGGIMQILRSLGPILLCRNTVLIQILWGVILSRGALAISWGALAIVSHADSICAPGAVVSAPISSRSNPCKAIPNFCRSGLPSLSNCHLEINFKGRGFEASLPEGSGPPGTSCVVSELHSTQILRSHLSRSDPLMASA